VVQTEHLSHFIEEFGFLISRRGRHITPPWWWLEIADNRHRAKLPEKPTNIVLSGQNGKLINGWATGGELRGPGLGTVQSWAPQHRLADPASVPRNMPRP